ncbi:hypothetical protein BKA70DRAFT_1229115 [Coprinopsis sp. MPI-PUGE-AT-0042]|nr:hypothetical protein BKA70DRAFT_1229115 [Coprinopsis sp. MPI-PUGE-AT-0042]
MAFPSPIGGIPLPSELGACILFIVLYSFLLPFMVRDVLDRRSRTFVSLGIMAFSIERIVVYILRALQTRNEDMRLSNGLINYQQTSFGIGYVGLSTDLLGAFRCLLVNPTYGPERYAESPAAATKDCYMVPPREGDVDRPRERFWARRISDAALVLFLTAIALSVIGNSSYSATFNDAGKSERSYIFRRVSASIALFGITTLGSATMWSYMRQPRAGKRCVITMSVVTVLIAVVASYRLSATKNKTAALGSMEPGSLNTVSSKILFYIFHAAPEWLVSAIVLSINVRKTFGTGPFGDWRGVDESPAQKERRLQHEAKRAAKREAKTGTEPIELQKLTQAT